MVTIPRSKFANVFFFKKDILQCMHTCTHCQQNVGKGHVKRVLLEIVPTVEEHFAKVSIDSTGLIVPAAKGWYRYILTIVDFAMQYPEAVILKNITSIEVADALINIFSWTGVPCEILSDRGIQFMSVMIAEMMCVPLHAKQLFSSPYHAQSNGLIEHFNGVIKKMLIKMALEQLNQCPCFLSTCCSCIVSYHKRSWGSHLLSCRMANHHESL